MRQAPDWLLELIEPVVTTMGYELVGVEYRPGGKGGLLRVYIDSEGGISVDDCEAVSHQLSGVLDVEDPIPGHYTLEVSSPGLDRPLFTAEQFERFAGHRVRVRLGSPLDGRRQFTGMLTGVRDGQYVVVRQDDDEFALPLDQIEQARLVPEF